ncbi:uncharacterized protein [Euphorbia lathyris]|uniref:uncharacterized protein isoform X2 n=1 Tax=Euphorbia lathyris TaxID=212925 RepID=UPI0033137F8F
MNKGNAQMKFKFIMPLTNPGEKILERMKVLQDLVPGAIRHEGVDLCRHEGVEKRKRRKPKNKGKPGFLWIVCTVCKWKDWCNRCCLYSSYTV